MAAFILGVQVVAACGTEKAAPDTVDPAATMVLVQGMVSSADDVERRAAAMKGSTRTGTRSGWFP